MIRFTRAHSVAVAVLTLAAVVHAGPPIGGETCEDAGANQIAGVGMFVFDNGGQTGVDDLTEAACESNGTSAFEADVWFQWTSDVDGPVSLQTCGQTALDTRVAVYAGTCDVLLIQACNDNACGQQSVANFVAVAGESYLLRIGVSPGQATGPGAFNIGLANPPQNDACQQAMFLGSDAEVVFDNVAANEQPASPPFNCSDGSEPPTGSVWFAFQAASPSAAISLCGSGIGDVDAILSVYEVAKGTDPCAGIAPIACSDDQCGLLPSLCLTDLAPGQDYLVRVASIGDQERGQFRLRVQSTPTEDCNTNGLLDECDIASGGSIDDNQSGIPDECETPNDFDLDGVPDSMDNCPAVYNPDQTDGDGNLVGDGCEESVGVDQIDWFEPDGSLLVAESDYGLFTVSLPNPGDTVLYVSAEIDGVLAIENMPFFAIDFPEDEPFHASSCLFNIGPRGTDVTNITYRLVATPYVLTTPIPGSANALTILCDNKQIAKGGAGVNQQGPPGPAANANFQAGDRALGRVTAAKRNNFRWIDQNEACHQSACMPTAVASSMSWLNETYRMGLPTGNAAERARRTEMKTLMKSGDDGFTQYDDYIAGKKKFIADKQLKLRVEGQGNGSPDEDLNQTQNQLTCRVDPEELFKQVRSGQDVEIHVRYTDAESNKDLGHTYAVVGMVRERKMNGQNVETKYSITLVDDASPTTDEGVTERTGQIEQVPGSDPAKYQIKHALENTPTDRIVGWTAESPTLAQIRTATDHWFGQAETLLMQILNKAKQDMRPTLEEWRTAKKIIRMLKFLAQAYLETLKANGQPDTNEEVKRARKLLAVACELQELMKSRGDIPGFCDLDPDFEADPDEYEREVARLLRALAKLSEKKQDVEDASAQPDADGDDVQDAPEGSDNSSLPNPDQEDCDGDGIGDIEQLDKQDCNGTARLDQCDIAIGWSLDDNNNGIPDECEVGIPSVSQWGTVVMTLILVLAGSMIYRKQQRDTGVTGLN